MSLKKYELYNIFSYAACGFNKLSYQTRSCLDIVKFKSLLKTELFINAYQI